jgi:M6 family metalloprotease-like protein
MKRGGLGITLLLTFSLIPAHSATPPKSGSICTKQGAIKTYQGKKYTCIKSGKKLVWNKGAVIKTAAPVVTPTPKPKPTQTPKPIPSTSAIPSSTSSPPPAPRTTPTPIPSVAAVNDTYGEPSVASDNIENCKIKEVNLNGPRNGRAGPDGALIPLPSGFPRVSPVIQHTGKVKWAIIPIDFPDLKGDTDFRSRIDNQTKKLTDWYSTVSYGKLTIEWSVLNQWVPLPNSTKNYEIALSANLKDSEAGQSLFLDAIKASDPLFNYSGIQQVIFILPKGQTVVRESSQGFPWDKAVIELRTQEGPVYGYSIAGTIFEEPGREFWSYWAHEYGHSISLPHIGYSRGEGIPPFNPWTLMGGQDGPSKELSGWERFLIGWMDDDQVYCKTLNVNQQVSLSTVPINRKTSGINLAIFPLPSGKALLIESRRVTEFSCKTPTNWDGVMAYVYDPNLSHGQDFLFPISPANRNKEYAECNGVKLYNGAQLWSDVLLHKGDKITIEGFTVEMLEHGSFNRIQITR